MGRNAGRELNYEYGTSGSMSDVLSRLYALKDHDGSTVLAAYTYLGAATVVEEDYAEPEVRLNLNPEPTAGQDYHDYNGFDRFGRIVDQVWEDYSGTPDAIDEFRYGYDPAGNRL